MIVRTQGCEGKVAVPPEGYAKLGSFCRFAKIQPAQLGFKRIVPRRSHDAGPGCVDWRSRWLHTIGAKLSGIPFRAIAPKIGPPLAHIAALAVL
jgi:hypothetical protein